MHKDRILCFIKVFLISYLLITVVTVGVVTFINYYYKSDDLSQIPEFQMEEQKFDDFERRRQQVPKVQVSFWAIDKFNDWFETPYPKLFRNIGSVAWPISLFLAFIIPWRKDT